MLRAIRRLYYYLSERIFIYYRFLRLSKVFSLVVIHFIPYGKITRLWVPKERLLPILAATRGFWCWEAIGQAKVRANTSITGKFLARLSLGNSNFVYIKVLRSPVSLAKSWRFFNGSVPAPIISQPIISLCCSSSLLGLKLPIRVFRPRSLWL